MNLREWALPVYTILIQLAVGSMTTLWVLRAVFRSRYPAAQLEVVLRNPVAIILITTSMAMVGSFFHLSRPYFSFLAIFNVGASWLSREVFFTVLFFAAVAGLWFLQGHVEGHTQAKTLVGWAAVLFGATIILCMTNCYLLPSQAAWNTAFTPLSFYSSAIVLGASASLTMLTVDLQFTQISYPENIGSQPQIVHRSLPGFAIVAVVMVAVILAQYGFLFWSLSNGNITAQASAQLYTGLYRPLLIFRLVSTVAGAAVMITGVVRTLRGVACLKDMTFHAYMACLLLLVGEILGRFLFYATHIRSGI